MKKLCAIISGGEPDDLTGIHEADFVIACDRGYAYAKEAGIRPDLLVGDFDSYRGALDKSVPVLDLPVEKDDTDTMAAVRWAVSEGFSELRLYCALGGRLDHLMGNIQALGFACERGVKASLLGRAARLYFLKTTLSPSRRSPAILFPCWPLPTGWSMSAFPESSIPCRTRSSPTRSPSASATNGRGPQTSPVGMGSCWLSNAKK